MNTKHLAITLSLLALAACATVEKRTFTIDAIDNDNYRKAWPCLVVVNQDWVGAGQRQQFINLTGSTPLELELTFDKPEILVEVAPVQVVNGQVNKVPLTEADSFDETGRRLERRTLRFSDAQKQLFVISR